MSMWLRREMPITQHKGLRLLAGVTLASALVACGSSADLSDATGAAPESASGSVQLTAAEVQTIIAQPRL